jgi:hypothetical protein
MRVYSIEKRTGFSKNETKFAENVTYVSLSNDDGEVSEASIALALPLTALIKASPNSTFPLVKTSNMRNTRNRQRAAGLKSKHWRHR